MTSNNDKNNLLKRQKGKAKQCKQKQSKKEKEEERKRVLYYDRGE